MITLGEARNRVTERLAETSGAFWTEEARNRAVNDAARLVATVTKGVVRDISVPSGRGAVSIDNTLAGINHAFASIAYPHGVEIVPAVSMTEVSRLGRAAFTLRTRPRWVVVDVERGIAFLIPQQVGSPFPWTLTVNVIPDDVATDSGMLFLGEESMDKYISPTVLLACAYLLLQERFDGDAERFYQLALQELTMLGVDSAAIPPLQRGLGPEQVA